MIFNIPKIKRRAYEKGRRDMIEEATLIAREQIKTVTRKKDLIIAELQNQVKKLEAAVKDRDIKVEKIENTFNSFGLTFGEAKYLGMSLDEENEAQMLLDVDRYQKVKKVASTMDMLSRMFRKPKKKLDKQIDKYKKEKAKSERN